MQNQPALARAMAASWLTGALVLAGCTPDRQDLDASAADPVEMHDGALANNADAMGGNGGMYGNTSNAQLDDSQIVHVAMTANRLDSTSAAAVVDRLSNTGARDFARKMITAHGAMLESLQAVTTRLGSTPGSNDISSSFEQMAAQPIAGTGMAVDRAYMDNEVVMHTQVLRTIDETLLPQVRDASLKALVERMRTAVAGHLQEAQSIRSQFASN